MTQTHPITPPLELAASLRNSAPHGIRDAGVTRELWLINSAYAAGADQELEACVEWLEKNCGRWEIPASLRAARRPKPPSLKEQALYELDAAYDSGKIDDTTYNTIRRALEQLND
jgi:hypothetical protein